LRAHRLEIVRDMRLYGEMHRFIPDIAAWLGARWTEVPVNHRPRRFGKSKYGIGRTFRVLLDLITIRYLQGYMTRPIRIFGKWGVVLGGAGVLLGLWLTAQKLFMGQSLGNRPALVLAVLLMVMGLQLISIGLLGEMVMRTYYETQGLKTYRVREVVDFSRGTPDAG